MGSVGRPLLSMLPAMSLVQRTAPEPASSFRTSAPAGQVDVSAAVHAHVDSEISARPAHPPRPEVVPRGFQLEEEGVAGPRAGQIRRAGARAKSTVSPKRPAT